MPNHSSIQHKRDVIHTTLGVPFLGVARSSLPRLSPFLFFFMVLFLINLGIRSWKIGIAPSLITHDEMYYALEAQTIAAQGTDPTGHWQPWHVTSAHALFAEWPGLVMSPAAALISEPWLAAKATSILMGALIPLLLAGISWQLFFKRELSVFVALIASFNPWLFQLSRMGYDALYSLFFLLAGIWILLAQSGWRRLWSLIPLVLAFYQYQGLKIIFVPIVLWSVWYVWYRDRHQPTELAKTSLNFVRLPLLVVAICAVLLFGSFWYRLQDQTAASRQGDLLTANSQEISTQVNQQRLKALPSSGQKIFNNKATVWLKTAYSQYLASFDWQRLFVEGDTVRNPASVWSFGIFYPLDAFLIILGLFTLFAVPSWRPQAWLLTGFILIAPLPQMINNKDVWIFLRSSFLFPTLMMVAGIGWYRLWTYPQKLPIFKTALIVCWIFFIGWFGYDYFYRYPVYATQSKEFGERVLANYVQRLPADQRVVILADESRFVFESLLVFTQSVHSQTMSDVERAYQNPEGFVFKNWLVKTGCIESAYFTPNTVVIADPSTSPCESESSTATSSAETKIVTIKRPADNGILFTIHQDELCKPYNLSQVATLPPQKIEELSTEMFCRVVMSVQ